MSDATRESIQDLIPGYALGALTPEETRAVETALAEHPELRRELDEYRELHGLLALAGEQAPSPELKARLQERIRGSKDVSFGSRGGAPAPTEDRRSLAPWAMGAGLAAAMIIAVGLSLKVRTLTDSLHTSDSLLASTSQQLSAREATLNALLEPSVELVTMVAQGEKPPKVQVFYDRIRRQVILHTFNVFPAKAGRAYQLWFLRKNGNPIPSQVFNTETSGHQLVQNITVPANEEITGFALTEEPAGGSPQPTTVPFVAGQLATK